MDFDRIFKTERDEDGVLIAFTTESRLRILAQHTRFVYLEWLKCADSFALLVGHLCVDHSSEDYEEVVTDCVMVCEGERRAVKALKFLANELAHVIEPPRVKSLNEWLGTLLRESRDRS